MVITPPLPRGNSTDVSGSVWLVLCRRRRTPDDLTVRIADAIAVDHLCCSASSNDKRLTMTCKRQCRFNAVTTSVEGNQAR